MLVLAIIASREAHADPPADVTLAFVGDINFAGRAPADATRTHPFAAVRAILDAATFAVGNLEGLLLGGSAPAYDEARMDVTAKPAWIAALGESGLDAFGLANNHSWDAGVDGLREHLGHLSRAGLATFGAGETPERAREPMRVATPVGPVVILGASLKTNRAGHPGFAAALYEPSPRGLGPLIAQVRRERAAGAFVVVSIHWGKEAVAEPPASVVTAAHALVDAGADLVVGHHPHVLQGIEWRAGSAIAYSLGNFVFRNRDLDKRTSGILQARLARGPDGRPALAALTFVPTVMSLGTFAPAPATGREAERIATLMTARSARWQTRVTRVGGVMTFPPPDAALAPDAH